MPNRLVMFSPSRVQAWPAAVHDMAEELTHDYGPPNERTDSILLWRNNSPWKRTVLYREGARHNFPRPHLDVLEQVIDMWVPVEKVGELAAFDGSLMVERTEGELAVRCGSQEMNILILNLAHDIIMNKLDAVGARRRCAQLMRGRLLNWPLPEMQELKFATNVRNAERRTADPDQAT